MNETCPPNKPPVTDADNTPDSVTTSPPPIPQKAVTLPNTMDGLLKRPLSILYELQHGEAGAVGRHFLIIALVCLGGFGFILGLCSGDRQLWSAPLKIILGVAVSGLITLPSLYIFSCLNGLDVSLKSVAGVLGASLALVSLLLIGLAPVLWIFTQSTDSLVFVGFLTVVFWIGSLSFGLSLLFKTASHSGAERRGYLRLWVLIFVIVTLQMSTTLRPLIGEAETLFPEEKKFFLTHWFDEISSDKSGDSDTGEG